MWPPAPWGEPNSQFLIAHFLGGRGEFASATQEKHPFVCKTHPPAVCTLHRESSGGGCIVCGFERGVCALTLLRVDHQLSSVDGQRSRTCRAPKRTRYVQDSQDQNPSELGTHKTARTRFWSWPSGETPKKLARCSCFARLRLAREERHTPPVLTAVLGQF
jgi:hypothetical protein